MIDSAPREMPLMQDECDLTAFHFLNSQEVGAKDPTLYSCLLPH